MSGNFGTHTAKWLVDPLSVNDSEHESVHWPNCIYLPQNCGQHVRIQIVPRFLIFNDRPEAYEAEDALQESLPLAAGVGMEDSREHSRRELVAEIAEGDLGHYTKDIQQAEPKFAALRIVNYQSVQAVCDIG
jgi:hypothetical protein